MHVAYRRWVAGGGGPLKVGLAEPIQQSGTVVETDAVRRMDLTNSQPVDHACALYQEPSPSNAEQL